jgi:hypothetical protein
VRVNVQLIDAETGSHLWAERFDKPLTDLFDMQDKKSLRNWLTRSTPKSSPRRGRRNKPRTPTQWTSIFKVWLGRIREWDRRADYPPSRKILARRELDVFVAELRDLARKLLKRKMPMHVGVKCDLHRVRPCLSVCATF